MFADQCSFDIRFEWGLLGLEALGPQADNMVVIDVLSFSTSLDIATARGATILPYAWLDDTAEEYAAENNAALAKKGRFADKDFSLSPTSLASIPSGYRLVLRSPTGSALSLRAGSLARTFWSCLRNGVALARVLENVGGSVAVIACGERWNEGAALRPCCEDFIGAGLLISHLNGRMSPEAEATVLFVRISFDAESFEEDNRVIYEVTP